MQSRIHKNMCTKLNVVDKILICNMLVFNGFHLFFLQNIFTATLNLNTFLFFLISIKNVYIYIVTFKIFFKVCIDTVYFYEASNDKF